MYPIWGYFCLYKLTRSSCSLCRVSLLGWYCVNCVKSRIDPLASDYLENTHRHHKFSWQLFAHGKINTNLFSSYARMSLSVWPLGCALCISVMTTSRSLTSSGDRRTRNSRLLDERTINRWKNVEKKAP